LAVETCNNLWYPGDDTVSFEERILFNEVFLLDGDVIIEARLEVKVAEFFVAEAQDLLVE